MKIKITVLLITLLLVKSDIIKDFMSTETEFGERDEYEKFTFDLLAELDIIGKPTITKSEFKTYLKKLLHKDQNVTHSQEEFYNDLIHKVTANASEIINVKDLHHLIGYEQMNDKLDELTEDLFGEEAMKNYLENQYKRPARQGEL